MAKKPRKTRSPLSTIVDLIFWVAIILAINGIAIVLAAIVHH